MLKGYIRPIKLDDAELVLEWRNQEAVRINMYNHQIISLATHMKWFNSILQNESCHYFIYERNQIPLGVLAISDIDKNNQKASWAFYSGDITARGIGSEMEQLALDYAFNTLNLNKLCCEVLEFNHSVINFHRKFGFQIEGIRRKDYYRDGKFYDIYQLALLKDEYKNSLIESVLTIPRTQVFNIHASNYTALISRFMEDIIPIYPGTAAELTDYSVSYASPINNGIELVCNATLKLHVNGKTEIEYRFLQTDDLLSVINAKFKSIF